MHGLVRFKSHKGNTKMSQFPSLNVGGYANVSVSYYFPTWLSYSTISNSPFLFIAYVIYLICLAMFLRRLSNQLKRTHKVLLTWTVVFVSIQALTQLLRIANDVLTIYARETAEASQLVEWSFFTAMNTVSGVTTFFTFINLMSLFVILFFVQQVLYVSCNLWF